MSIPDRLHPTLHTPLCDLVGVRFPVVQTGMGWVSGPGLTAATANAGGLGILAGATMTFAELERAVDEVRGATDASFGVNLRADQPDVVDRIDLLADRSVRVASFALAPKPELIERCKDHGLVVIPSVGAARHAEKVAGWGADAVIVQGGEGGGHTGPVPTSLLLPDVLDRVDIPVIAAGGFRDGRGLVAAIAYGAAGVAMGTRFLLTRESPVVDEAKRIYLGKGLDDTIVTTEIDGVPQRVLRAGAVESVEGMGRVRRLMGAIRRANEFRRLSGTSWPEMIREGLAMRRSRGLAWHQVLLAANAPMLYRAALLEGRTDVGIMASGQVAGLIDDLPTCAELIDRLMLEADAVLRRLQSPEPILQTPEHEERT
jgi:NAD(P)H-dependent flavin oxidoreductase YrpB (nitropropane dioxygenase family)